MYKRLFIIRDAQGRQVKSGLYYWGSKAEAKIARDILNKDLDTPQFFVTPGPDHRKFK